MHEDNNLLAHLEDPYQILKNNFVHDIVASLRVSHLLDAVERAFQWCGSVRTIKRECALVICTYEVSDIGVVWKGG